MESIQKYCSFLQEPIRLSLLESTAPPPTEPHPFHLVSPRIPPLPVIPPLDHDQEQ